MPIASAGSSSAPKDGQMLRYYHLVPKPPPPNLSLHHPIHGQLNPTSLQVSVNSNPGPTNHSIHHHHSHLFGVAGTTNDANRSSCIQDFNLPTNSNLRQLTPPLTINVGPSGHQEVSAQVAPGTGGNLFGAHSPPASSALLNLSPGLNPAMDHHRTSPIVGYDFHRRSLQGNEI